MYVFLNVFEASRLETPITPDPGTRYIAGIDWGRAEDFTVITIIDEHSGQQVVIDRSHNVGFEPMRRRVKSLFAQWNPVLAYAVSSSIGEPHIEALRREGLPVRAFDMSQMSKPALIDELALAIEIGDLTLLNDDVQIHELRSFEVVRLPHGAVRYQPAQNGHDDTVIALALAWYGVRHGRFVRVEANPLY